MLEPEDQKKDIWNSLTRVQNLMSLDVWYINKAEELMKREHNTDLQSSQEALHLRRSN
jgi:hypothetical protein